MSKEQYAILIVFSPLIILLFYLIIVLIVEDIRDYFSFKKKRKILKEKIKKELKEYYEIAEKVRELEILERENIELKELINKNDYTIKQLKLILETAIKTLEVKENVD